MILTYNKPHLIKKLTREIDLADLMSKMKSLHTIGTNIRIELIPEATQEDIGAFQLLLQNHTIEPDPFIEYKEKILRGQPIGAEIVAEFGANNMVTQIPREQRASFASQFVVIQNLLMGGSLGLAKDAVSFIPEGIIALNVKTYFLRRIQQGIDKLNEG